MAKKTTRISLTEMLQADGVRMVVDATGPNMPAEATASDTLAHPDWPWPDDMSCSVGTEGVRLTEDVLVNGLRSHSANTKRAAAAAHDPLVPPDWSWPDAIKPVKKPEPQPEEKRISAPQECGFPDEAAMIAYYGVDPRKV